MMMKNLKKLSRNDLKTVIGKAVAATCWVHVEKQKGLEVSYGDTGGGSCPTPPSGYSCKYFHASGSC